MSTTLTGAERDSICTCPWTNPGVCPGDAHETRCSQHRAAVEALLAAREAAAAQAVRRVEAVCAQVEADNEAALDRTGQHLYGAVVTVAEMVRAALRSGAGS